MTQHYIYSIRHKASGKRYIGRSKDVIRRWKEHVWGSKSSPICHAIRKNGVDAFDFEVIAEVNEDQVEMLEAWYIHLYDCVVPRGYNLINRGDGNCGHHPATCTKISAAHMGKVLSEETRAKMSASRMGHLNPNFGKSGANCRGVTRYDLEGRYIDAFPSQHLAAIAIGDGRRSSQIGHACDGNNLICHSYQWRRSEDAPESLSPYVREFSHGRMILQMKAGQVIGEPYTSITAAAAAVGVKPPNISAALAGKCKRCKGFEWRYADGGAPRKRVCK